MAPETGGFDEPLDLKYSFSSIWIWSHQLDELTPPLLVSYTPASAQIVAWGRPFTFKNSKVAGILELLFERFKNDPESWVKKADLVPGEQALEKSIPKSLFDDFFAIVEKRDGGGSYRIRQSKSTHKLDSIKSNRS